MLQHSQTDRHTEIQSCQSKTHYRHGFLGAGSYRRRRSITINIISCGCSDRWWRFTCILQSSDSLHSPSETF